MTEFNTEGTSLEMIVSELQESGVDFKRAGVVLKKLVLLILDRNEHNRNNVRMREHFVDGERSLFSDIYKKVKRLDSAFAGTLADRKKSLDDIFGYAFLWLCLIENGEFGGDYPKGIKRGVPSINKEESPIENFPEILHNTSPMRVIEKEYKETLNKEFDPDRKEWGVTEEEWYSFFNTKVQGKQILKSTVIEIDDVPQSFRKMLLDCFNGHRAVIFHRFGQRQMVCWMIKEFQEFPVDTDVPLGKMSVTLEPIVRNLVEGLERSMKFTNSKKI